MEDIFTAAIVSCRFADDREIIFGNYIRDYTRCLLLQRYKERRDKNLAVPFFLTLKLGSYISSDSFIAVSKTWRLLSVKKGIPHTLKLVF